MVPGTRLELVRCCHRWILSPLRLPIPPPRPVIRDGNARPVYSASFAALIVMLPMALIFKDVTETPWRSVRARAASCARPAV